MSKKEIRALDNTGSMQKSAPLPPIRMSVFDTSTQENPFVVPADQDILHIREAKERDREERRKQRNLPVWEKGLKFNRAGALRRIEEIELDKTDEDDKKVSVAEAAHTALVTDRVRTRENMTKVIEKKREMFLLQMMIELKKEEIKKMEEYALVREYGLKTSEDMLIEDMNLFNEYWEECKKKSHKAMNKSKKLNKRKIDITHEINKLNEQIQQVAAQNQKNEETLEECKKYKAFLDKITPQEHAGNGEAMYFERPGQLMEIFHDLVEHNLFLIQNMQELEQTLEGEKHKLEGMEREKDTKLTDLRLSQIELQKSIDERAKRCSMLQTRLHKSVENEQSGFPLIERIESAIKDTLGEETDEGQHNCLGMLSDIEHRLDTYLRALQEIEREDSNYYSTKIKALESTRRDKARAEAIEKEQKKNNEKLRKYVERAEKPKPKA